MPMFSSSPRVPSRSVIAGRVGARSLAPLVLLLLLDSRLPADETAPDVPAAPEETWQVIYIGDGRVGYGHIRTSRHRNDAGVEIIRTDVLNYMEIKRFNVSLKMTTQQQTEETADGRLLSFHFKLDNPPISHSESTGRLEGDKLHVRTIAGGQPSELTLDWGPDVKSPAWQDRDLEENPLQPGETREYRVFDPQLNQIVTVGLSDKGAARTTLLDGTQVEARRVAVSHSLLPGIAIQTYLDAAGEILKTETNLLQMVTTYSVDRDTALEELKDQPLDLAIETLVHVEPIERAHERKRIVYRIEVAGGDPAEHFAAGGTQHVAAESDTAALVTVTSLRPREAHGEETADPVYLKSTRFLGSSDERVVAHAAAAVGERTDPAEIAVAMEKYVHDKMVNKNFATGLATASEVARDMEGDCTEHAVLLAAMLRVRDIPSRVVIGLVYAQQLSAFGGHMWTEAFLDGAWAPLDATLARGGIGAGHIKVSDSSLDEDAPTPITAFLPMIHLLGQMKVEVVEVE